VTDPNDYKECVVSSSTSSPLSISLEPRPRTYLTFAQEDLSEINSQRTRVNALSNAKRALHFQVDLLSEFLGIEHARLGKRLSFPQKLEFCVNCGVVGPRILSKLNRLRNAVEHEYYLPTKEEAEDFVDVVELFLGATNQFVRSFPDSLELESPEETQLYGVSRKFLRIEFPASEGVIRVKIREFNGETDILHSEAQKWLEQFKADRKSKRNSGVKEIIIGSPEETAYRSAFSAHCQRKEFEVKSEEGAAYYNWVKFILEKVQE
jgi:hypothetical protein